MVESICGRRSTYNVEVLHQVKCSNGKKLNKRKEKIVLTITLTIAIKNYLTIVNSLFGIKGNLNAHLY